MSVMSYNGAAIIGTNYACFFLLPLLQQPSQSKLRFVKIRFRSLLVFPDKSACICVLTEMRLLNALTLIILLTHI